MTSYIIHCTMAYPGNPFALKAADEERWWVRPPPSWQRSQPAPKQYCDTCGRWIVAAHFSRHLQAKEHKQIHTGLRLRAKHA